jgi:TPR repeat protein
MMARPLRCVAGALLIIGIFQCLGTAVAAPATGAPTSTASRGGLLTYLFRPGPTSALAVRMDASWTEGSRYHDGELREIRFVREPKNGAPAQSRGKLLVTPMATLPSEKLLGDTTGGREIVAKQLASMAAQAVEKSPPITDAKVGAGRFVSFTVTDAHPKPGEFARSTQGVLTMGALASSVTILHNDLATRDEVVTAFASWSAFGTPNVVSEPSGSVLPKLAAACKHGDGLACGLQHEWASGDPGQKAKAGLALLTAGCKAGSAFACGSLGSLYAEGTGVAKDEARARKILAQGCDAHGWLACVNAGSIARRGRPAEAPPTPEMLGFLERACGYGGDHDSVCRFSTNGDLPPAEYLAAQTAGCAKNDARACRNLGWTIETGYAGVTVDVDAARDAYHKACAVHSLWGCFREALFTTDLQEQARLYDAACKQGSGPACYALAQPTYGRAPDVRRALVRKACDSSIEMACVDYLAGFAK